MLAKLILDKLNAGVVSCYTEKRWTRSYCLELWINFTTMIFRIVIGNISKHFTFLIDGYTFLNGTLRFFLINIHNRKNWFSNSHVYVLMWTFCSPKWSDIIYNLRDIELEGNVQRRTRYRWYLHTCVVPLMNMFRASVREIIYPLSKSCNYVSVIWEICDFWSKRFFRN